jgi:uncharacterized protein (TIGR02284 family)
MTNDKMIEELNELIRFDRDAISAYLSAINDIRELSIRGPLTQFRADHERHVIELSAIVRRIGGKPVEHAGIKGVVRQTMTKVAGLGGSEYTLRAMKSNEEMLNRTYAHHLSFDWPEDLKEVISRNYSDEQRHLAWIDQALQARLWEGAPAQP